jgi:hypothetical protein
MDVANVEILCDVAIESIEEVTSAARQRLSVPA